MFLVYLRILAGMKNLFLIIAVLVLVAVGVWYLVPQTPVFTSQEFGFSIKVPPGYTPDTSYVYQLAPGRQIKGVKFTIPEALTTGTNLSRDTYVSVESLPNTSNCSAGLFLDGDHPATTLIEAGQSYSYATASNAGAGNRYDESVYALPDNNACLAMRYLIHQPFRYQWRVY
jgi:hypothetical protein